MLPDPPPQHVGSADPIRIRIGSPRICHGNISPVEGNVSGSHETDPMKNQTIPDIFKWILKLPVLL